MADAAGWQSDITTAFDEAGIPPCKFHRGADDEGNGVVFAALHRTRGEGLAIHLIDALERSSLGEAPLIVGVMNAAQIPVGSRQATQKPRGKRRWYHFRLWGMLCVMLLVAAYTVGRAQQLGVTLDVLTDLQAARDDAKRWKAKYDRELQFQLDAGVAFQQWICGQ